MTWTEEELVLLRERYNDRYDELGRLFPGRSKRALKHKITDSVENFGLGLKRDERKRWSEAELVVLRENPEKTARELAVLLGRSEFQVSQKLRGIRGSANRRFRGGWDVPSRELAYFLGALMSDGTVAKYSMAFVVKKEDMEFSDRFKRFVEDVIGFKMTERELRIKLKEGEGVYRRLWCSSSQFAEKFGFYGAKGDWVVYLDRFRWVWDDLWFWSFLGGLYDGDGCLKISDVGGSKNYPQIIFAIKPDDSRKKVMDELLKRGFYPMEFMRETAVGFYLNGGKSEVVRFIRNIDSSLSRKRVLKKKTI